MEFSFGDKKEVRRRVVPRTDQECSMARRVTT